MTPGTAEFVRKLRKVIKVFMWLWMIGTFVLFWFFEKTGSQMRTPTGTTLGSNSTTATTEAIKAATRMDWQHQILLPWIIYGIAPAIVLGVVLYLMPGRRRKPASPSQ